MSIPINTVCMECHLKKRFALARQLGGEGAAMDYSRYILKILQEAPPEMDSTWLGYLGDKFMQENFGMDPNRLKAEKEFSNRFVLDRLPEIEKRINAAPDPVFAALQFSILGNYLDFSALQGEVSFDALETMLDSALEMPLDKATYGQFCRDLTEKPRFLYLTDNAGEIVFDKLLADQLKKRYPHLEITFCVRGSAVSNDATREDAVTAGITYPVIDNGTAIGGTVLRFVGAELKEAFENAQVILAKGMGNTESLYGCSQNVYYAFLVKCDRMIQFFGKTKLTPMFIRASVIE